MRGKIGPIAIGCDGGHENEGSGAMLLAIDVGNTQTVLGVYENKKLRFRWRVATNKLHTCDELRVKLIPLLSSEGVSFDDISGVALASVVPALTDAWQQATKQMIGVRAVVCTAENAAGLFDAGDYPNPREIGADRIADCVAARMLYGSPVVVVDFGTATNMEVIDGNGAFAGGVIAPGVDTSARALFSHATKLGAIELVNPHTSIGRNTAQAMQVGIVYGEADRVDGLVNRIFEQLGYKAAVVATGGLARRAVVTYHHAREPGPDARGPSPGVRQLHGQRRHRPVRPPRRGAGVGRALPARRASAPAGAFARGRCAAFPGQPSPQLQQIWPHFRRCLEIWVS